MDTAVTIINLVQLIYSTQNVTSIAWSCDTRCTQKTPPIHWNDGNIIYTSNKQQRLSLNIIINYLHSCIYFINISAISAPGKQNVNVTVPVVYISGLNSISFYREVRLVAKFSWQIGFANKRNPLQSKNTYLICLFKQIVAKSKSRIVIIHRSYIYLYTPYNRLSGKQMLSRTQIISTSHGMTGRNFFDVFLLFHLLKFMSICCITNEKFAYQIWQYRF